MIRIPRTEGYPKLRLVTQGNTPQGGTKRMEQEAGSAFRHYLEEHNLLEMNVANLANVRYATVHAVSQGQPIRASDAQKIRNAIAKYLPRSPYHGPILIRPEIPGIKQNGVCRHRITVTLYEGEDETIATQAYVAGVAIFQGHVEHTINGELVRESC